MSIYSWPQVLEAFPVLRSAVLNFSLPIYELFLNLLTLFFLLLLLFSLIVSVWVSVAFRQIT